MTKYVIILISLVAVACLSTTTLAGHTVLSGVDLYPYNAQRSGEVDYYKGFVFVAADGTGGTVNTVHSVDVSDPYNVSYISSSALGNKSWGLKPADDKVYVACWTNYLLRVLNISPAGALSPLWQIDSGSFPASCNVDVSNQRAFVMAAESGDYVKGVRIIDISDDNPPVPINQIISTIPLADRNTGSIVVRGSYAYYTDGNNFVMAHGQSQR